MSQTLVERKQLLVAALGKHNVTAVDIREITLAPGQAAGRHLHPCAVVGYIVEGTALYEIEGEPSQLLQTGAAFYEPANVTIAEFGNASATVPMKFIAFYLLDGEQELITILGPRQ